MFLVVLVVVTAEMKLAANCCSRIAGKTVAVILLKGGESVSVIGCTSGLGSVEIPVGDRRMSYEYSR